MHAFEHPNKLLISITRAKKKTTMSLIRTSFFFMKTMKAIGCWSVTFPGSNGGVADDDDQHMKKQQNEAQVLFIFHIVKKDQWF
ncbi:hypothetical protein ACMD2_18820 [Ananas comosus]|uniref:Uncharacterized protein n=1 Tax=Ananas comosus TaxID=4615 RepID=A0A199VMZ3_ANACO|nr:hypothetical protein ACMD2_18820 [Ananas comosus]